MTAAQQADEQVFENPFMPYDCAGQLIADIVKVLLNGVYFFMGEGHGFFLRFAIRLRENSS